MTKRKRCLEVFEDAKGYYYIRESNKRKMRLCIHKKRKCTCKDCGGVSICKHGKRRQICRECKGASICKHGKRLQYCKQCDGVSLCVHGVQFYHCRTCDGGVFCEHGKRRFICKICRGSSICKHSRFINNCRDCKGSSICEHDKRRSNCYECNGSNICQHNKLLGHCKTCNPNGYLKNIVSSRIRSALKQNKNKRSVEYLGCDMEFYRMWLEMQFKPGMSWENHGAGEGCWNIDHKVPVLYTGDGEVTLDMIKERLHYSNTWPMWASENLSKSNKFKH